MSVTCNVHKSLLCDPQECHLHAWTPSRDGLAVFLHHDINSITGHELSRMRLQSRFESIIVEHSRAQIGHHVAYQGDRFRDQFHRVTHSGTDLLGAVHRNLAVDDNQIDVQRGKSLPYAVVEFTRDGTPLVLLDL